MTFIDEVEQEVKDLQSAIVADVQDLREAIGERPYGEDRLSEEERVGRYLTFVRDNPDAWAGLLATHGQGPTLTYAEDMEKATVRVLKRTGVKIGG